jgi:urease accessory protein
VETRLRVSAGARIDWLPQETILFDGARVERRLTWTSRGDGTALLVEPVVFGRLARGEELRSGLFSDRWEVRRDGRLVMADRFRIGGTWRPPWTAWRWRGGAGHGLGVLRGPAASRIWRSGHAARTAGAS